MFGKYWPLPLLLHETLRNRQTPKTGDSSLFLASLDNLPILFVLCVLGVVVQLCRRGSGSSTSCSGIQKPLFRFCRKDQTVFINYRDSRPIYEQIVDQYKKMILVGVMAHDEQMPSVRSLAAELSANPNTVQKAYAELERQGFIYTVKGRGNFVCGREQLVSARQKEIIEEIRALFEEAREVGLTRETVMEALQRQEAE